MGADDLPGLLAVVAAALYARGLRRPVQGSAGARGERVALLRATAFIGGLAVSSRRSRARSTATPISCCGRT